MKKMILKNKKALSPVVASIILIAVTVAVSIAVAAWMGALTFTFTATEQLQITRIDFGGTNQDAMNATVLNTGTSPVTITEVRVNNVPADISGAYYLNGTDLDASQGTVTLPANTKVVIVLSYTWQYGNNYEVKLLSSKGNPFMRTETAPTG